MTACIPSGPVEQQCGARRVAGLQLHGPRDRGTEDADPEGEGADLPFGRRYGVMGGGYVHLSRLSGRAGQVDGRVETAQSPTIQYQ